MVMVALAIPDSANAMDQHRWVRLQSLPPRNRHAMVALEVSGSGACNDRASWRRAHPRARALGFASQDGHALLVGGEDAQGPCADAWRLEAGRWTQLQLVAPFGPRRSHSLSLQVRDRPVVPIATIVRG